MIKRATGLFVDASSGDESWDEKDQTKLLQYMMDPEKLFEVSSDDNGEERYADQVYKKAKEGRKAKDRLFDFEDNTDSEEEEERFHGKHRCQLCPEKTLISDQDLEDHLKSKSHLKRERNYYRVLKRCGTVLSPEEEAAMPDLGECSEDEPAAQEDVKPKGAPEENESGSEVSDEDCNGDSEEDEFTKICEEAASGAEESDGTFDSDESQAESGDDSECNEVSKKEAKKAAEVAEAAPKEKSCAVSKKALKKQQHWEKQHAKRQKNEGEETQREGFFRGCREEAGWTRPEERGGVV